MKAIQGAGLRASSGAIAKDGAEVLGKEGHLCQGKTLNSSLHSSKGFKPEGGTSQFWIQKAPSGSENRRLSSEPTAVVQENREQLVLGCGGVAARGVGQRDILYVDLTESLMKQEEEYVKSNSKLPALAR